MPLYQPAAGPGELSGDASGEPLTPPALRFLQELKGHLLAQDNVQVYL